MSNTPAPLDPCPFCGGKPYINPVEYDDPEEGRKQTGDFNAGCSGCDIYTVPMKMEELAKTWNRRAPRPVPSQGAAPHNFSPEILKAKLQPWANILYGRYGAPVYLVGSSLQGGGNDVDVRVIIPYDEFYSRWPSGDDSAAWAAEMGKQSRQGVKWVGAHIDLQVQNDVQAIEYKDKPRLRLDSVEHEPTPEAVPREAGPFAPDTIQVMFCNNGETCWWSVLDLPRANELHDGDVFTFKLQGPEGEGRGDGREGGGLEPATVGGRRLSGSMDDFEHKCLVEIARLNENHFADNALIGLLCEAVRCVREYGDVHTEQVKSQGELLDMLQRARQSSPSKTEPEGDGRGPLREAPQWVTEVRDGLELIASAPGSADKAALLQILDSCRKTARSTLGILALLQPALSGEPLGDPSKSSPAPMNRHAPTCYSQRHHFDTSSEEVLDENCNCGYAAQKRAAREAERGAGA